MTKRDPKQPPPRRHRWGKPAAPERRGYGKKHRRIRRQLLKEEPNCRICGKPATHADHIIPLCLGGPTERSNYQALCEDCSRKKTSQEGHLMRRLKRDD